MGQKDGTEPPAGARVHVLTMTDTIGIGGAEEIVLTLNESLDSARFQRTVCVTRDPRRLDPHDEFDSSARFERLRAAGVEILILRRGSKLNLLAWLRLIRFICARQVDVIHAHKFGSNFWGAVLGKLTGVPVIIAHEHTWSFEGQRLRRLVDRRVIARFADAVIAVSDTDRQRMINIVGMPPERVVLIANGIPPLPPGDGALLRLEAGIAEDSTVLVAVANLRPQKAFDVLLRAVALLRPRFPQLRLLVAGGGDRASLEELAGKLGISEMVIFLGARRDVENVLAAGQIAVSSSDFEGSPLAAMEYLAAGLPIVATRVGGMPDLVHDGENGLLVPPREPHALAEAIGELLSDPARAAEMGEHGRALQHEQFSLHSMVQHVQDLYLERLTASGARSLPPRSAEHETGV
jgi:glycosyltransferase involved in cell wall biosynthesis